MEAADCSIRDLSTASGVQCLIDRVHPKCLFCQLSALHSSSTLTRALRPSQSDQRLKLCCKGSHLVRVVGIRIGRLLVSAMQPTDKVKSLPRLTVGTIKAVMTHLSASRFNSTAGYCMRESIDYCGKRTVPQHLF
jgi:hypothetical protein